MWCMRNESISRSVCKMPHACDLNTVGSSWPEARRWRKWIEITIQNAVWFSLSMWMSSTYLKILWCRAIRSPYRQVIWSTFPLKPEPYLNQLVRYSLTVPLSLYVTQCYRMKRIIFKHTSTQLILSKSKRTCESMTFLHALSSYRA